MPAKTDFQLVIRLVRMTGWEGAKESPVFSGEPLGDMTA